MTPSSETAERLRGLGHLIGNTPMLRVDLKLDGRPISVYAKAENVNMTGSLKDRIALHIIRGAYESGDLTPGAPIVEATSGNTGISFAAVGRALGHPVTIFMPDWLSIERINLIRAFGADIRLVSAEEGGFATCLARTHEFAEKDKSAFLPRQFENELNVGAHEASTGPEIWWQLRFEDLTPAAFVAGVGTGGTVMGVGRYLRSQDASVHVHPLEPSNSPTLRVGHKIGHHRIQGISDEFVPAIVDLASLDRIVSVDDGDAIIMAQRIAAELGLGVGLSSGANLLGAVLLAEELDDGAAVVTVFPDDNKKYLSTALFAEEPACDGHISPRIELVSFAALKRVCMVCCDCDACERPEVILASSIDGDGPACAKLARG
jgi:cysteine synthase A